MMILCGLHSFIIKYISQINNDFKFLTQKDLNMLKEVISLGICVTSYINKCAQDSFVKFYEYCVQEQKQGQHFLSKIKDIFVFYREQ